MQKKYIIRLSDEERGRLTEIVKKFKGTSQKVRRAQILLKADTDGPAWTDARIADAFGWSKKGVGTFSSADSCGTDELIAEKRFLTPFLLRGELVESEEPIGGKPTANVSSRDGQRARIDRLRLPYLLSHYPARVVWAAFLFVNGFLTIGLLASVAMLSGTPFVFPSLGPTAFMLFHDPMQPAASPRNALCGHALGILCGYAALLLTGLTHAPPTMVEGVLAVRVLCAALSLASTGALMVLLGVWHPPAGATTLIVALGIISQPYHLLIIEAAVVILILQGLVINRLAGIEYPVWAPAAGVRQRKPVAAEGRSQEE